MDPLLEAAVTELKRQLPRIESGSEKGLLKGIARAREWAETDETLGTLRVRSAMLEALDRVEITAPHLAHLAGHNLVAVLEHVFHGEGQNYATRSEYFRTVAGFEERRRAAAANALERLEATLAQEEDWEAFTDMISDIGQLALRTLVPLLLAAI